MTFIGSKIVQKKLRILNTLPFGELFLGYHIYPQLRCFAACSGFHDIGPAPRNLQFILNCSILN